MLEFKNSLKLYCFKNENRISLSLLSSPTHVLTFYMTMDFFERITTESLTDKGANIPPYLVHRKGSYVRFTHSASGIENNLRVDTEKWMMLIEDYRRKVGTTEGPLVTCIVP